MAADLEAVGQVAMWHATAGDAVRELARVYISPDAKEHGIKAFAKRVFPHKSDEQAYTRLMNCTNPNSNEELDEDEWRAIIRIGHEQDKHFVAEYFVGAEYRITAVRREEVTKRAKKQRIAYHLSEAARLSQEEE